MSLMSFLGVIVPLLCLALVPIVCTSLETCQNFLIRCMKNNYANKNLKPWSYAYKNLVP